MLIIYYRVKQNTKDCGSQQLPASLVHFRKPCPVFRTLGDIGLHLIAGELPAFGAKPHAFFTAADTYFAVSPELIVLSVGAVAAHAAYVLGGQLSFGGGKLTGKVLFHLLVLTL